MQGDSANYSLYHRLVEDRRVMVAKPVMDGTGTPLEDSPGPLNELTQTRVEAHVEDFLKWCKTMIA